MRVDELAPAEGATGLSWAVKLPARRRLQALKLSLSAESPGAAQRSLSQEEVMLLILIPLLPTETRHSRDLLLLAVLPAGTRMPQFGLLQLEKTLQAIGK